MPKTTAKRPAPRRKIVARRVARNGVLKTVLPNGLTVVLKENHNAPVATFWVWYRVGSGRERTGITGISHWVEHMLFKGTEKFPGRTADQVISREGGQWNGFTWLDFTTYFETLPAEKIELGLSLEADRMVNAPFRPRDVSSERTVIISEKQGGENSPRQLLGEEVQAAAFRAHGYGHETIGHLCDLQTMTRDDLYNHYRTYYAPNNAVAVAVGAFKADEMLKQIEKAFGKIKRGPAIAPDQSCSNRSSAASGASRWKAPAPRRTSNWPITRPRPKTRTFRRAWRWMRFWPARHRCRSSAAARPMRHRACTRRWSKPNWRRTWAAQ